MLEFPGSQCMYNKFPEFKTYSIFFVITCNLILFYFYKNFRTF